MYGIKKCLIAQFSETALSSWREYVERKANIFVFKAKSNKSEEGKNIVLGVSSLVSFP